VAFLWLLAYAAAEVAAFVAVVHQLGVLTAVLLVIAVSACGPFLVRRVGLGVLAHARLRLARGEPPTRELLDGVMVFGGGVLVCIPGFVGDALGLLLMIPAVRHLAIRLAGRRLAHRLRRRERRPSPRGSRVDAAIRATSRRRGPGHPSGVGEPRVIGAGGEPPAVDGDGKPPAAPPGVGGQ